MSVIVRQKEAAENGAEVLRTKERKDFCDQFTSDETTGGTQHGEREDRASRLTRALETRTERETGTAEGKIAAQQWKLRMRNSLQTNVEKLNNVKTNK